MKCFVVFLMTLVVVNSFPLKNDEDFIEKEGNVENTTALFFSNEIVKDTYFTFGESLLVSR